MAETVWAVVDKHRCLSVWTTEKAAWEAADPDKGQIIVETRLTPTIAASTWTGVGS